MKYWTKITSDKAPTVELDSEAEAAYVRFSKKKVFQTRVIENERTFVAADLAKDGSVIGLEFVGISEFTIERLMEMAKVSAPKRLLRGVRYLQARPQEMVEA